MRSRIQAMLTRYPLSVAYLLAIGTLDVVLTAYLVFT